MLVDPQHLWEWIFQWMVGGLGRATRTAEEDVSHTHSMDKPGDVRKTWVGWETDSVSESPFQQTWDSST